MLKPLRLIRTEQQACEMSMLLRFSSSPGTHTHSERVQLDESSSLLIAREGIIAYECVKKCNFFPLNSVSCLLILEERNTGR